MGSSTLGTLLVAAFCSQISSEPAPQFAPSGFHHPAPPHNERHWAHQTHNHSVPAQTMDYLNPEASHANEERGRRKRPRQSPFYIPPNQSGYPGRNEMPYSPPPQPSYSQGYPQQGFPQQGFQQGWIPQIYKVDNLIIIANPPQQQACPDSKLKPLDPNTFPGANNDPLANRNMFGEEEPSLCTWAIVACCAPGSSRVRTNCFELMGCPGLFVDGKPCDMNLVEAASRAALNYYNNNSNNNQNSSSTASDSNRV